jgi:hypothetical protein
MVDTIEGKSETIFVILKYQPTATDSRYVADGKHFFV